MVDSVVSLWHHVVNLKGRYLKVTSKEPSRNPQGRAKEVPARAR